MVWRRTRKFPPGRTRSRCVHGTKAATGSPPGPTRRSRLRNSDSTRRPSLGGTWRDPIVQRRPFLRRNYLELTQAVETRATAPLEERGTRLRVGAEPTDIDADVPHPHFLLRPGKQRFLV